MWNPWWYQTYLLQLENYELLRFWQTLVRRGFFPPIGFVPRQKIVWTPKLLLVVSLAIVICFASFFVGPLVGLLLSFGWSISLSASLIVVKPFDVFVKHQLIARASKKLQTNAALQIIGIAGSYGKTTVKECVAVALAANKKVLKTPENINTPVGIARLILKEAITDYEVFVVEMGEYKTGDIAEICQLTKPDIAIVTGVNEAHAERMGNIEVAAKAIFEVATNAKQGGVIYVNFDDANIIERAPFLSPRPPVPYNNSFAGKVKVMSSTFDEQTNERTIRFETPNEPVTVTTKLLGSYMAANCALALDIALRFGVSPARAAQNLAALAPVPHRLESMPAKAGVVVIDDSYNGNPDGFKEAINVLSLYSTKRKILLTPGLVEMGDRSRAIHEMLGQEAAKTIDRAILIKNSVTPHIAAGLKSAGFAEEKIVWFNSAHEAHAALGSLLRQNDVILFQNDWPDNYV